MENLPTKSTGSSLTAVEFNQIPDELENAILSTGQTLSAGDLFQIAQAMAHYATEGAYYSESGAADAYVLSAIGSKKAPTSYIDGQRVRFIVGNTNTSASTVNLASLGVKDIRKPDGTALLAGDLISGVRIEIEYDSAAGYFVISNTNPAGVGQTWQNVTASRVLDTLYTNTTKRPIQIIVTISKTGVAFASLSINGSVTIAGLQTSPSDVDDTRCFTATIPPGATYFVNTTGSPVLTTWAELR